MLILAMSLAGCKKEDTSESTSTSAPTKADTTQEAEATEEPAAELDPYQIDVIMIGNDRSDTALVEEGMNELLADINATVKFTFIASSNWTQQTNLMNASSEKIDILWTSSFYGYSTNVANGQILPLNDLLSEYGSSIVEVLGTDTLEACKIDGEVYGVPSTRDMAANYGVSMRADLVEKYGIDVDAIATMEDLTPVFATIKENEPDMIATGGWSGSNTMVNLILKGTFDYLDNWFGVIRLDDPECNVINYYETPEYAQMCDIVHEWYQAGYVIADAATTTESPRDLIKAGKEFSVFYSGKPGIDQQTKGQTGYDIVSAWITPAVKSTSTITVMMASIGRTSEDPARTMMLLDRWYSDADIVNLFDLGVEGVHYVMDHDNVVKLPDGVTDTSSLWPSSNFYIGNNYLSYVWQGSDSDQWDQMKTFNDTAVQSPALGFAFDAKPVETEIAATQNVIAEYRSGLETGTLDPAVKLPEFIQKLKDAGIETIMAEKQAQIDAWLAGK